MCWLFFAISNVSPLTVLRFTLSF